MKCLHLDQAEAGHPSSGGRLLFGFGLKEPAINPSDKSPEGSMDLKYCRFVCDIIFLDGTKIISSLARFLKPAVEGGNMQIFCI